MNYTDILRQLFQQQYPELQETKTIVISTILLRLIPAPAKPLFFQYQHLENLVITKCDLRTLDNFPRLKQLRTLDISDNSLQGSLNNLMPLTGLEYLNVANNLISDYRKLLPLQLIDSLEIYVAGNPFVDGEVWKNKIKSYGIKVLKEPKLLQPKCEVKQEENKQENKIIDSPIPKEAPNNQANNEGLLHQRNNFLLQIRARRRRAEEQRRRNNHRGILELESDSNSIIHAVQQHQPILEDQIPQYSSSGENEGNSDEEEEEQNNLASEQIEPFFNVFLNEDLEIDEYEDEQQNDNVDESVESES